MGLTLVTHPTIEPVTAAELRKQVELAATDAAHDDHLARLIRAARRAVERETRKSLITQTWLITSAAFPLGPNLWLPRPPLLTVTHVKYYDSDGVLQTWPATEYRVVTTSIPGRISLLPTCSWPCPESQNEVAVQVTYTAGFGATAASVPEEYHQAIMALATYWFEVRTSAEIPESLAAYLRSLRSGAGVEFFDLSS